MREYSFADGVRIALAYAAECASDYGHSVVDVDHLLLAVLERGRQDRDMKALAHCCGVDVTSMSTEVLARLPRGNDKVGLSELLYTAGAKAVLQRAVDLSHQSAHGSIGTDHLFAALAERTEELVRAVLSAQGLTSERVAECLTECRARAAAWRR